MCGSEKKEDGEIVGGQFKMNWVGEDMKGISPAAWARQSGVTLINRQLIYKTNAKTAGRTQQASPSLLLTSTSLRFENIQMRGTEPAAAGWPLMFSHHTDGHPERLWCAHLWALKVVFCKYFVRVRIWALCEASVWHCGDCIADTLASSSACYSYNNQRVMTEYTSIVKMTRKSSKEADLKLH